MDNDKNYQACLALMEALKGALWVLTGIGGARVIEYLLGQHGCSR